MVSLNEIYKEYKHGEDFERYGLHKVNRALSSVGEFQTCIVETLDGTYKLYNYVPEEDKFFLVMEEKK